MKHKTYDSVYFWQHAMEKSKYRWENLFAEPITEKSVFGHFVIVNCYGVECLNNWIMFPNSQAFTGFLKYVFLPTAYVEWFTREESEGFIAIEATPEAWIKLFRASEKCKYKQEIPVMEEDLRKLDAIWSSDEHERIPQLKEFAAEFTHQWTQRDDLFFYFQMFTSPEEVGKYVTNIYERDDMPERIEEQLGMSKEEWLNIANDVYENEFMKRRFIDILNNRVEDML